MFVKLFSLTAISAQTTWLSGANTSDGLSTVSVTDVFAAYFLPGAVDAGKYPHAAVVMAICIG